ncbi:unnamed protein product [Rotaria sordida]|uniref:Cytochrome P450 n=1 Tax=Rotaria sordida TaxID=392033 RepID=A0A819LUC6_9BILA|nr:unnamed protein product [Rotaria sordida]CAF3969300.1 unnamed protein product [Rotaria sordida]
MINEKDPETVYQLSDENILYQMVIFLIAGHETTSKLLLFILYYLLQNPYALQKVQAEIDQYTEITIDTLKTLASEAPPYSYNATISTLDSNIRSLPNDRPIIIITASYEVKKQLQLFAQLCKNEIENFTGDIYEKEILDLYSSYEFSFEQYLQILSSLRIR